MQTANAQERVKKPKQISSLVEIKNKKSFDTLKNSDHFNIIFRNGLKLNNNYFTMYVINTDIFLTKVKDNNIFLSNILMGFSINKKVALANKRNLVKRRIKYILVNFKKFNLNNLSFIFVCRKGIDKLSFIDLSTMIEKSISTLYKKLTKT